MKKKREVVKVFNTFDQLREELLKEVENAEDDTLLTYARGIFGIATEVDVCDTTGRIEVYWVGFPDARA